MCVCVCAGFISGGARGGFFPPYEGLCPPQVVELILNFGHAYRDKSNSGLYNIPLGCLSCPPLISDTTYWPPRKQYAEINPGVCVCVCVCVCVSLTDSGHAAVDSHHQGQVEEVETAKQALGHCHGLATTSEPVEH